MICLSNRYNQHCRGFDGREGRRRSAMGIAVNSPALSQYETAQGLVGVSTEAGASIGVTSNPRLCPLRSRSHHSYNQYASLRGSYALLDSPIPTLPGAMPCDLQRCTNPQAAAGLLFGVRATDHTPLGQ